LISNNRKIFRGLSRQEVERIIHITPDIEIKIVPNSSNTRFTIDEPGKESLSFLCDSSEDALNWIQILRGETFRNDSMSINDFKILSVIGRGFYGKVMLVRKKDTGELFAIKSVRKSNLTKSNKVHTIMTERDILIKSHFEFIISLRYAFQTDSKFYFVLEFASGGELFHLLEATGPLSVSDTRLYIAEIALALQYLHSIGVIYRDLKLENVLIAYDGHVKLTDFGLSKELLSDDSTTSTFCGTTEYLAPEVIRRQPYSYMVDWWSLGILTYEIMFGDTPFSSENKSVILNGVVNSEPHFPDNADPISIDFIRRLLEKNPEKRATLKDLIHHPFWGGMDFDLVLQKKYAPFFTPRQGNDSEPLHFDDEFTMENPTDSLSTPVFEPKGIFVGFSFSEEMEIDLNGSDLTPSSILTLGLIDPVEANSK